jgi:hypothetical protein
MLRYGLVSFNVVVGSFEHGTETSDVIKARDFLG